MFCPNTCRNSCTWRNFNVCLCEPTPPNHSCQQNNQIFSLTSFCVHDKFLIWESNSSAHVILKSSKAKEKGFSQACSRLRPLHLPSISLLHPLIYPVIISSISSICLNSNSDNTQSSNTGEVCFFKNLLSWSLVETRWHLIRWRGEADPFLSPPVLIKTTVNVLSRLWNEHHWWLLSQCQSRAFPFSSVPNSLAYWKP